MATKQPRANARRVLRLYVAGKTQGAAQALERLTGAAAGRFGIELVDVLEKPEEAETAGILATPALSDESVHPPRRLLGDVGDVARVLEFFGYRGGDASVSDRPAS